MSGRNADELVVAGTGDIYIAPYGTPVPTQEAGSLDAAFAQAGYTNEDGLKLSWTPEVTDFMAWQSRTPIRREMTSQEFVLAFSLEQWNADNLIAAFGGGQVTEVTAGHYKFEWLDNDSQLDEITVVADFQDGSKKYRWIGERGTVTDSVETNLVRGDMALLPISFKVLEVTPYLLTNDPAFNPAAS